MGVVALVVAAAWAVLAHGIPFLGPLARGPSSTTAGVSESFAPTPAERAAPTPTLALPSLSSEPVAVAVQFDQALNAGDVQLTLALFNPAAQVKIPPNLYLGQTQIWKWVRYLAAIHFAVEPGLRHQEGTTVTWPAEVHSDHLTRLGLGSLRGHARLVVDDGRIAGYTFILMQESAADLRAAQLAALEPLADSLVVGANSANVYGAADVFRTTDGTLVSYRDVVAAEPGSGPFYDLGGEPIIIRTGF